MSDTPITDAANAISDQSPKIKAFARLVAAKLEPPVVPPPPPPSGPDVFLIHYGDSDGFEPPSKYGTEYALTVAGWGTDPYLSALTPGKGCAYRTCVEVEDATTMPHSFGGLTLTEARQGGWLLHDATGKELAPSTGIGAGDIGSTGYQARWCANVSGYLASQHITHLFLDNVTGYCWFGLPAKYPTQATWRAAYLSMLDAQRVQMPNVYRLANAGNPADPAWFGTVAQRCDGVMIEGYDGGSTHNAMIAAARKVNADVYGNVTSDAAPWTKSAAMHKAFRQAGGQFFGVNSGGPDPYAAAWVNA